MKCPLCLEKETGGRVCNVPLDCYCDEHLKEGYERLDKLLKFTPKDKIEQIFYEAQQLLEFLHLEMMTRGLIVIKHG